MQINTPEAMLKAFRLRQKYGSWEEVERVTGATQHSINILLGTTRDGEESTDKPQGR